MSDELSKCHLAPVRVAGRGDFDDSDTVVTTYYVCIKCDKPCDLATPHSGDWLDEILRPALLYIETKNKLWTKENSGVLKARILSKHKLEVLEGRIDELKNRILPKLLGSGEPKSIQIIWQQISELENEQSKIEGAA